MLGATSGTIVALDIGTHLPATLTAPGMSEADFVAVCAQFPDAFLEYTADGTLIIMPPTDPENSARVLNVGAQLLNWAHTQKKGLVTGPDGGFFFPNGARRSPDAAWFDTERWRDAKKDSRATFPRFAPEFVIEVRSPHDRLSALREKMEEYMDNGVQLAWLIDPKQQSVTVYQIGRAPIVLEKPATLRGAGPLENFELNFASIW